MNEALYGDVECRLVSGRSSITRLYSRDPLKLLAPTRCGSASRVVMSSFGGGLLAGDCVPIRVRVEPATHLLLTTQSSGKVYRSDDGRMSQQHLDATVEQDAILAVLPDVLSCFEASRYTQTQRFDLRGNAGLVWLDWFSAGRSACGERWAMHTLSSRTDVRIDGSLELRETIDLTAAPGDIGSMLRMGRFGCFATLLVVGEKLASLRPRLAELVKGWPVDRNEPTLASISSISGGSIVRVAGADVRAVESRLRELIAPLASVFGEDPWARKW